MVGLGQLSLPFAQERTYARQDIQNLYYCLIYFCYIEEESSKIQTVSQMRKHLKTSFPGHQTYVKIHKSLPAAIQNKVKVTLSVGPMEVVFGRELFYDRI